MRKLDITAITDSKQLPIKKGTLQFLQDAYGELLAAVSTWMASSLVLSGVPVPFSSANAYILYGCFDFAAYPAFATNAGAILYNGELFLVDASSFTLTGSNVPLCTIVTTQYGTDADPVTYTDITTGNIHNIRKIVISQGPTGTGTFDFLTMKDASAVIWPKLNLTNGANTYVTGAYPNLQVNAPAPVPSPILLSGTATIGDVPTAADYTVSLGVTLADTNYMVFGTVISKGTPADDSTVIFAVHSRTTTSFKFNVHETANVTQNVDIDWFIIHK